MSYAEQLKDPRWQKKRLEIMERDEWTCQTCGDTEATLTVHHKSYKLNNTGKKFIDIWKYPHDFLITLCEKCHSKEEANLSELKDKLFFTIRECFENSEAIYAFSDAIVLIREGYGQRIDVDLTGQILNKAIEAAHSNAPTLYKVYRRVIGEENV